MSGKELRKAKGDIIFKDDIIISVINLATKEIAGVSSIVENVHCMLKRWLNKKNYSRGVKIQYNGDKISVDVYINVYFGYNVSDIASRVQENIKNSIASMIDTNIDRINVHVLGVEFETQNEF